MEGASKQGTSGTPRQDSALHWLRGPPGSVQGSLSLQPPCHQGPLQTQCPGNATGKVGAFLMTSRSEIGVKRGGCSGPSLLDVSRCQDEGGTTKFANGPGPPARLSPTIKHTPF